MNKEEKCWMVLDRNNRVFIKNTTLDKAWKAVEALSKNSHVTWTVKKQEVGNIPYLNTGYKEINDDGGHIIWYLFHKDNVPTDDEELLSRIDFTQYYSGPGGLYSDKGFVKRVGKRVLVTQNRGLDI